MKSAWMLVLSFFMLFPVLHQDVVANPPEKTEALQQKQSLDFYFFHRSRRCFSCNAIENNTKKTLETHFGKQLKDKEITFRVFNIDESENQLVSKKFNATGTSLFMLSKNGQEELITNLSMMAMKNARNEAVFAEELSKIIREALAE